jgi:hypothetical protein
MTRMLGNIYPHLTLRLSNMKSIQDIKVIETIEVNGCYLKEHRYQSERREILKLHFIYYDRRFRKHRRQWLKLDIQA